MALPLLIPKEGGKADTIAMLLELGGGSSASQGHFVVDGFLFVFVDR